MDFSRIAHGAFDSVFFVVFDFEVRAIFASEDQFELIGFVSKRLAHHDMHSESYHESNASIDEIAQELSVLAIFAGLPHESLLLFAERTEAIAVSENEDIYSEGEQGDSLYVLRSGVLEVIKNKAGQEKTLAELRVGEVFGEMSFVDMQARSATVRAKERCELFRFSYDTLVELRRTELKTFTLLFMNLAREISRRLRRSDTLLMKQK